MANNHLALINWFSNPSSPTVENLSHMWYCVYQQCAAKIVCVKCQLLFTSPDHWPHIHLPFSYYWLLSYNMIVHVLMITLEPSKAHHMKP